MKKIRLGVFIETEIFEGGGYQQSLNSLLMISKNIDRSYEPIFISTKKVNLDILKKYEIDCRFFTPSKLSNIFMYIKSKIVHPKLISMIGKFWRLNSLEVFLKKLKVDLVFFTSPSNLPLYTDRYNFIYTIWDLCHRDNFEFPEVRCSRVFEQREMKYQLILPKAYLVLVDSELSKIQIIKRYGLDNDRVLIIPFSPSEIIKSKTFDNTNIININEKYKLKGDYLYYPAQFWPHKNHIFILEGIALLEKQEKIKINVIFSGSDKGNKSYVLDKAKDLGIQDRIKFVGFVDNEEVPHLYMQSMGLIMPSYFGPTNIPPLEAFKLGVPLIYSDIPGSEEQIGNAAIKLNLYDIKSFIEAIKIIKNNSAKQKLIESGYQQLKAINKKRLNSEKLFFESIKKFATKRRCWY